MPPAEPLKSIVRLFLSVDIVGSTSLKSRINSSVLYDRLSQSTEEIKRFIEEVKKSKSQDDDAVLNFVVDRIPRTDWDWTYVFESILKDFDQNFLKQIETQTRMSPKDLGTKGPWKLIGDELVYVFEIKSFKQLHDFVLSFVTALVQLDKAGEKNHKGLRLKGSGWVAGFPVRNSEFPIPGDEEGIDYLGPDIDIGFRLGAHSRSGMFAASVDLVELLGRFKKRGVRQLQGKIVGWKRLKGVWNDEPYPIIWLKGASEPSVKQSEKAEEYFPFKDWEKESDPLIRKWCNSPLPESVGKLTKVIHRIRKELSDSLGLVPPYLVSEGERIPPKHLTIKEVLERFKPRESDQESVDIQSDKLDRLEKRLKPRGKKKS